MKVRMSLAAAVFVLGAMGSGDVRADVVDDGLGLIKSVAGGVVRSVGVCAPSYTRLWLGDLSQPGSGFSVSADYTNPAAPTIAYRWHGSARYFTDEYCGAKVTVRVTDASGFTMPYVQRSEEIAQTTPYNSPDVSVDLPVTYYSTAFPGARQLSTVTVEGKGYFYNSATRQWVLTDCKQLTFLVSATPARPTFVGNPSEDEGCEP